MVATVDQSFIDQFSANIHHLVEQKKSIFRPLVQVEMSKGEKHFFERLGSFTAEEVVGRAAKTNRQDPQHSRRMATVSRYHAGTYLDDIDKFKLLIDPKGAYAPKLAQALGRKFDEIVIDALLGDAASGKDGSTAVALPAGQKIADGGVGLTIEKLITARKMFASNELFDEDFHLVISPEALEDLLLETEIQSADYNSIKALVRGDIDSFMGFKFHISNLLPTGKSIAFTGDALKVAMAHDLMVHTAVLPDYNYMLGVDIYMMFGAVRMEEPHVIEISHV